MTSASDREATKQIVCIPASARSATNPVASLDPDSADCHSTTSRPGWGEQSSSTTSTFSTPSRRAPASAAFVDVALDSRKTGSAPCIRQSLRSRRMTWATWAPKTPRYRCASSMTTYLRLPSREAHREWEGNTVWCSMSGLVRTYRACSRANRRSASSESPSRVETNQLRGPISRQTRSWSWARAFVGARYKALLRFRESRREADRFGVGGSGSTGVVDAVAAMMGNR